MIHVAYCFDPNYRQHVGASLTSLLLNFGANGDELHVHLVTDRSDDDFEHRLDRLRKAFRARIDVRLVPADVLSGLDGLPTQNPALGQQRMVAATWFRVLLPDLLPDIGRVLYLDADTIVLADVSELWDGGAGGSPVAAVLNRLTDAKSRSFGLRQYVNSGVMLLDLDVWRAEGLTRAVLDRARRDAEKIELADQDAINLTMGDRAAILPARWNRFIGPRVSESDSEPASIIHFVGKAKPWESWYENPLGRLYWRYLDVSPWAGAEPEPARNILQLLSLARLKAATDPRADAFALYERALGGLMKHGIEQQTRRNAQPADPAG